MRKLALRAVMTALISSIGLWAQPVLLSYFEREPYYFTLRGEGTGFLLERTKQILTEATIPFEMRAIPSVRISHNMEGSSTRQISPGWFKTPEREAFSRFSRPIYRNLPQIVLTRADHAEDLEKIPSFSALTGDNRFVFGAIEGFSYGDSIDRLLSLMGTRIRRINASTLQCVEMLAAGRFDYILLDREEAPYLIRQAGYTDYDLVQIEYPDIPEGNLRYLWCSLSVTDEEIERIDRAIERLYPDVE